MDNMSRQYRKEKGIEESSYKQNDGVRNINSTEESLFLGVIRNKFSHSGGTSSRQQSNQVIKKINLEDLIGNSEQPIQRTRKCSSAITLEELANKHSK